MRLYLVQHGEAVPTEENADRPLTERGRKDVARLGKRLVRTGIDVYRIEHSGKTRADQTAQILGLAAKPTNGIHALDGIGPADPVEPMAQRIESFTGDRMIVSHNPFLGNLATRLVLGKERPEPVVRFVPGTLAILERSTAGDWAIVAVLPPMLTEN